ncbi:MAG: SDR family oxidoreductase [Myxococcales bacterium]|nr:SDR family oxidoreductase [Myxococcales bacterium]
MKKTKTNKRVLITGASTGIGRCATQILADWGDTVYACARKDADLEELGKIKNVIPLKLDVTQRDQIEAAVKQIEEEAGSLDALVNNAGISVSGPLMDIPEEEMRAQFEVNVFGLANITQALFPLLHKAKGRIVNISSIAARIVTPFLGPYCMSKFAVEAYSDALRRELMPLGMKVVIIQPGPTKTAIWGKTDPETEAFAGSLFEERAKKIGKMMIERADSNAFPPEAVGFLVYEAIHRAKPKTRYLVTPEKLPQLLLSKLPDQVIDSALAQVFG